MKNNGLSQTMSVDTRDYGANGFKSLFPVLSGREDYDVQSGNFDKEIPEMWLG